MTQLTIRLKILPKEVGLDLNQIAKDITTKLPDGASLTKTSEEPIAFGLVALIADIATEDKEGMMDKIEEAVRSSEGVSEVEVLGISRTSTRA